MTRLIRKKELLEMTGLSQTTLWRWEKSGKFPARIRLSGKRVAWREDEIMDWIENRPRGNAERPVNFQGQ